MKMLSLSRLEKLITYVGGQKCRILRFCRVITYKVLGLRGKKHYD